MSFDPHPIDRLALSCLLIEGVALLKLPSPSPSLHPGWRTGISTKLGPKNRPHANFSLRLAEQGNPALLQHTPQVGFSLEVLLEQTRFKHLCASISSSGIIRVVGRRKNLYV